MTRPSKTLKPIGKTASTTSEELTEKEEFKIEIGPPKLTRFEKARIIGARSLQLSLGAPPFIPLKEGIRDPISLSMAELEARVLPISIRRILPDSRYQDIPIDYLL